MKPSRNSGIAFWALCSAPKTRLQGEISPAHQRPWTTAFRAAGAALALCTYSFAQKQDPGGAATAAKEGATVLSPFEVIADPSDTYQALNTSSLTGN